MSEKQKEEYKALTDDLVYLAEHDPIGFTYMVNSVMTLKLRSDMESVAALSNTAGQ